MAYQNIPVADGYQVAQQIANFAGATGWTVHRSSEQLSLSTMTPHYEVTLSFAGYPGYVTVAGYSGTVVLNGHRGYDNSKRWWEQPDQFSAYDGDDSFENDTDEKYTSCYAELRVNPILSVHLFGGSSPTPYLYAAIEKEPGYYRHLVIGHLQKFGSSSGGMFWDVSSRRQDRGYQTYAEYHRAPFLYTGNISYGHRGGCDAQNTAGESLYCVFSSSSPNTHMKGGHWASEFYSFMIASPIGFNGRTGLMTPLVHVASYGYVPFGTPPAFRYVDMTFFEAGDELVIGNDTWKVFPWARRTQGVRNSNNSDYYGPGYEATDTNGIAYLKG